MKNEFHVNKLISVNLEPWQSLSSFLPLSANGGVAFGLSITLSALFLLITIQSNTRSLQSQALASICLRDSWTA